MSPQKQDSEPEQNPKPDSEIESALPPDIENDEQVAHVIKKLEEEKPEAFTQIMAMAGSMGNPLHQKMNEEHISTVLGLAVSHDEREYDLAKRRQLIAASRRWFKLAVLLIVLAFICVMIFTFRNQPDVLVPLISAILAFAGGFGSGWGLGRSKD